MPWNILVLNLKRQGNLLTGGYDSGVRFLAKIESGNFTTTLRGNVARIKLKSGHGGAVTAQITLQGDKLRWKLIKTEGEYYFPDEAVLHRESQKRSVPGHDEG